MYPADNKYPPASGPASPYAPNFPPGSAPPPHNPGYPPPQNSGYPPAQNIGYPPADPGYPPTQGYPGPPPGNPGYPPANGYGPPPPVIFLLKFPNIPILMLTMNLICRASRGIRSRSPAISQCHHSRLIINHSRRLSPISRNRKAVVEVSDPFEKNSLSYQLNIVVESNALATTVERTPLYP